MPHTTWTMRRLDEVFGLAERASLGYWVRMLDAETTSTLRNGSMRT